MTMLAFIRSRNLPFSVDDVRKMTKSCQICNECKPRFYNPERTKLIKATQTAEQLNLGFSSNSNNKYIFTIVDEYSRFPFAIPCQNVKAVSVYKALFQIFSIFGIPAYIHSDRGAAFMSSDLKKYLHEKGVATSLTTPYNPQGNGLVERYNSTIWKAVTLALKAKNLPPTCWEIVLPDAFHSIRSLISTSTNCTPHERMFNFKRRTSTGTSLPTWVSHPGPAFLKRHVRLSKYDTPVDEVELIEANPSYAYIRHKSGSLRNLAPITDSDNDPFIRTFR